MRGAIADGTSDRCSERRARLATARWPRLMVLLPMLLGCDIVQGFQDAGDALFPDQSTHLSAPGLRLVKGGYRRIGFAAGRELSVVARSTEDETSLFVMRFANPKPCKIPNVGRFVASRNPNRPEAGIAYFHDDATQGTLHFADTSCKTFDLEIDDAVMPVGETERTVIVWAAGELLEVDPIRGERTTLASEVSNIVARAFSGRTLVLTKESIEVFGSDWKSQGTFGQGVGAVVKTNAGVLYLDATGLRRLSSGGSDALTKDELLVADACHLGMRDDTWATFHAPCSEGRLRALHEPSGKVYDLAIDADPRYLRLLPARGSRGRDPVKDPFWFLFVRDVAESATFVVRRPNGVENVIGRGATLDHADLYETDAESHGYALVNVNGGVGDYVYFDASGNTTTLAHNTLARSRRLLVDWDGSAGNLAAVSGARLALVANRVPETEFEFVDANQEWTVLFHDLQDGSGRLSRLPGTLDSLAAIPVNAPFESPPLEEVAANVAYYTTSSLGTLIPGVIFMENYDAETNTGRLSYENAQLRFKATVDAGVSDYLATRSDLLYCIPYGENQGIWLATGK